MSIELAKKYLPLLDEVYATAAKSSILDAPAEWVREGAKANEVLIPSVAVDGLGDYSRTNGYVAGEFDFTWETHQFTQDRGRSFIIDAQDNAETLDIAFAATTGQFIRTKVVPEVDAYRFAVLASKAGDEESADLTANTALQAIDKGLETFGDGEVAVENVIIFVSPKVHTFLKQSNLLTRQFDVQNANGTISRVVDYLDGHRVIEVPQSRFYTSIDLYDGTTVGQTAGGYVKADDGLNINFLLVDPQAALGITKTALPRIFSPDVYQGANAWKFDYRLYHDLFVPGNKVDGIYLHTVAAGS